MDKKLFNKLQEGRRKYQLLRSRDLRLKEAELFRSGKSQVGRLSERDVFIAGISLYWAEGFKHKDESGLGLATMDLKMAMFYIHWLGRCLGVGKEDLLLRVTANYAYKDTVVEMEQWWATELGVCVNQFSKPFFQHAKQARVYPNSDKYHGVLRIRVRRSIDFLRKMRGWMAGMVETAS